MDNERRLGLGQTLPLRQSWLGGLCGAFAALCAMALFWGFTVDDALISCRVASHLNHGLGYRFNAHGPAVDAVTPLGWALLLAPFAQSTLGALNVASWLGACAGLLSGAVVGVQIARLGERGRRFLPLIVLGLCAPLGAWFSAGMETGLITLLCTLALLRQRWALVALVLAVFLRPELLPWAFTLQVGWALGRADKPSKVLLAALSPCLAFALAAGIRQFAFGNAAPLGFMAKPSTWQDGLGYVWGAFRLSGPPLLLLAWKSWRKVSPRLIVIALAGVVHCAALVAVGGDWMPFFRLFAPVLPGWFVVSAALAERSSHLKNAIRLLLALLACSAIIVTRAAPAREIKDQRLELIESLRSIAHDEDRIATLDVGWVGAASDATLIDLSGVTDPTVARLTGGHTSKHLPNDFLERFKPTLLVLLTAKDAALREPWFQTQFDRVVEQRVARLWRPERVKASQILRLPLRGTAQSYVVVRLIPVR